MDKESNLEKRPLQAKIKEHGMWREILDGVSEQKKQNKERNFLYKIRGFKMVYERYERLFIMAVIGEIICS